MPTDRATVHVDTTLLIEQFKAAPRPATVREGLRGFKFISTSSYARFEFKKTWIRSLMYLYDRASRVTHVAGLITEINQSFGKQKSNNLTRSLEAWCAFNPPGQAPLPDAAALLRLKTQLKIAILNAYKQWSRLTHHEWDGTGCLRAREAPRQSDDGKIDATVPRCWRTRIQCTIHTFFEENRDLFIQIEQAVAQKADASEQLKAAAAVIRAALVDPRSLCEDKVCQRVGDVLIAIDGNKMSTFAANNPSEWELLSLVLKKPLINPVKGSFVV